MKVAWDDTLESRETSLCSCQDCGIPCWQGCLMRKRLGKGRLVSLSNEWQTATQVVSDWACWKVLTTRLFEGCESFCGLFFPRQSTLGTTRNWWKWFGCCRQTRKCSALLTRIATSFQPCLSKRERGVGSFEAACFQGKSRVSWNSRLDNARVHGQEPKWANWFGERVGVCAGQVSFFFDWQSKKTWHTSLINK